MAPLKFEDFSKKIKDIFGNDFAYKQEFKAKQKINSIGAVVTTTVELNPKKGDSVCTPAKVSLKWPKPMGLGVLNIDKFEYSPKGDFKLEAALDKSVLKVDGLELEVKSDLKDEQKVSAHANFTGIADTRLTLETKPFAQDFTLAVARNVGPALMIGCSLGQKNFSAPDVGLRISQSGILACLMVTEKFKTFEGFGHYAVGDALELTLNAKQNAKGLTAQAGLVYTNKINDITVKAKVDEKGGVETVTKYSPSKGITFLLSGKYANSTPGYGVSVSIE